MTSSAPPRVSDYYWPIGLLHYVTESTHTLGWCVSIHGDSPYRPEATLSSLRQKFQDGTCSQEFFMFIKIRGTFHVCIVYIYFSFKRIRSFVSLILLNFNHRLSPVQQLMAATVKISSQDTYWFYYYYSEGKKKEDLLSSTIYTVSDCVLTTIVFRPHHNTSQTCHCATYFLPIVSFIFSSFIFSSYVLLNRYSECWLRFSWCRRFNIYAM